jgi:BlaI family transcriptional regulator, penicillinase repressor
MPAPLFEKLTRREREIMDTVFALPGGASVDDVRARLSDPPSYSAVRTMLTRLEEKGVLRHREEGLRYVYEPTTPRTAARRAALQQLVRVFFDGSPGQTATALLKNDQWTDEELAALQREIDAVRKERKRS